MSGKGVMRIRKYRLFAIGMGYKERTVVNGFYASIVL